MRRLILCYGGTWNQSDQEWDGVLCPTEGVKMAYSVATRDGVIPRTVYYDQTRRRRFAEPPRDATQPAARGVTGKVSFDTFSGPWDFVPPALRARATKGGGTHALSALRFRQWARSEVLR
jgi:hypothetical protein